MKSTKFRKSLWLPLALAAYSAIMSCYFGPSLISDGQAPKFWISVGVEFIVVVALFFVLRRKEKLKEKWDGIHKK